MGPTTYLYVPGNKLDFVEKAFNKGAEKKVFLIGDSQMAAIMFDLKDKVLKRKYEFNVSTIGSCIYFPGFDRILIKTGKIDKKCNNE